MAMRVAIVDDRPLARLAMEHVVRSVPGYAIAWQANDGAEAVRLAAADTPDVILMDLIMPVMSGAEATRRIMHQSPCSILIVTASVQGNFSLVMEALSHGGLDPVDTPVLAGGAVRDGEPLLTRLARLERQRDEGRKAKVDCRVDDSGLSGIFRAASRQAPTFLALGASTGGPAALAAVLEGLPARLPVPAVVAQHMRAECIPSFVEWLRSRAALPVEVAVPGQSPRPGVVSVAMTDDHLVLGRGGRFEVVREPAEYPFRPSVNALFESLLGHVPGTGVAVLLTGMGSDGAAGLLALRRSGWLTLAQDEASSVVYGMPKAAAELRAASRVLPLAQIAAAIRERFG